MEVKITSQNNTSLTMSNERLGIDTVPAEFYLYLTWCNGFFSVEPAGTKACLRTIKVSRSAHNFTSFLSLQCLHNFS